MKGQKALTAALCCCVLALCVAIGIATHFRQESREAQAKLTMLQERNDLLESELLKLGAQMEQMEEDAERERENAQSRLESAARRDNPIDQYYFSNKRTTGTTTLQMCVDTAFYREAWKQEFNHVVNFVTEQIDSDYDEDYQLLEEYRSLVERQVEITYDLAILRPYGMSREERYENRQYILGTYGPISISFSEAMIYRNGAIWLLDRYYYVMDWSGKYPFAFDGSFIEENYGGDDSMFPPLSEVLPDQS